MDEKVSSSPSAVSSFKETPASTVIGRHEQLPASTVIARNEDKAPIKRKQSQACLSYAEHEALRRSQSRALRV